jgi:fimbrial chaperone protein
MGNHTFRSAVLLGVIAALAGRAEASSFTVNPIKVVLSDKEQSALLTLQNQSTEELRFKVLVQEWKQSPKGEMQLAATKDIVVYPGLLTLPPNGERKLRVGATVPAAAREQAYRVFVEELPGLRSAKEATKSEVKVLTKMGVPIFLRPAKPVGGGAVEGLVVVKGSLSITLKNTGNIHFLVQSAKVKAADATGASTFEKDLEGWYVLSGGIRVWELELPKAACIKSKKLTVEVQTNEGKFDGSLDVQPAGCSP